MTGTINKDWFKKRLWKNTTTSSAAGAHAGSERERVQWSAGMKEKKDQGKCRKGGRLTDKRNSNRFSRLPRTSADIKRMQIPAAANCNRLGAGAISINGRQPGLVRKGFRVPT